MGVEHIRHAVDKDTSRLAPPERLLEPRLPEPRSDGGLSIRWRAPGNVAYGSWESGSPVTSLMLPINVNTINKRRRDSTESGRIWIGTRDTGVTCPVSPFPFPESVPRCRPSIRDVRPTGAVCR